MKKIKGVFVGIWLSFQKLTALHKALSLLHLIISIVFFTLTLLSFAKGPQGSISITILFNHFFHSLYGFIVITFACIPLISFVIVFLAKKINKVSLAILYILLLINPLIISYLYYLIVFTIYDY